MLLTALADAALDAPRKATKFTIYGARLALGLVTHRRPVDDIEWSWLEGGNPKGEPLILLHGFSGSKDNWLLYAPLLAGRYRVICPDLPGFGESTRDIDEDYGVAAQVSRLAAFLGHLGIERCHLGGNSLGGYIALSFALEHPARLLSLSLFNNAGVNGAEQSDLQRKMADGSNPLRLRSRRDLDRILGQVIHRPPYIPFLVKYFVLSEYRRRGPLLDHIFSQCIHDALERPLNDRLDEVAVPTIIFWGRQDGLLDVSAATLQHQRIAGSKLVIFDDVGHVPMIERPLSTSVHHREFLMALDRASPQGGREEASAMPA